MTGKHKISGRETIVIDESEISQLDELSMTSVVRQLEDTSEMQRGADDGDSHNPQSGLPSYESADSTINEFLDALDAPVDSPQEPTASRFGKTSSEAELPDEAVEELLPADILFPDGAED